MSIIKSVSSIFSRKIIAEIPMLDPTEYRITTNANEYVGLIVHQDDFSIHFLIENNNKVKILKSTITAISVAHKKKS